VADRPRTLAGQIWRQVKRVSIGAPLSSARLHEQKLSKIKALPIFSSDALSSTAYATEEILLRLILVANASLLGVSALGLSIPISIAIALLLVIVATSYRQTIRAYPQGGGAYKVALENIGRAPGLVAGASLFVDYSLTVAVSTAAGVAAITSAVPELHDERIILAVVFVSVLTVLTCAACASPARSSPSRRISFSSASRS
jgi:amino acid transporter